MKEPCDAGGGMSNKIETQLQHFGKDLILVRKRERFVSAEPLKIPGTIAPHHTSSALALVLEAASYRSSRALYNLHDI